MKRAIIIRTVILSAIAAYTGIFLYQRYLRRKADNAIDSEQEALQKLKKAMD